MQEFRIVSGVHDMTITKPTLKSVIRSITLDNLTKASPVIKVIRNATNEVYYFDTEDLKRFLKIEEQVKKPEKQYKRGNLIDED